MRALVSGFFPATCVLSETGSPLAHLHREEILCGSAMSGFSVQVGREGERREEGGGRKEGTHSKAQHVSTSSTLHCAQQEHQSARVTRRGRECGVLRMKGEGVCVCNSGKIR